MLRFHKFSAVAMALAVALTACTEGTDGTGPDDEPFAPDESAADLQIVQGAFAASVFESLALSSESFILVQDSGAVSAGLLQASLAAASAGSHWEAEAAARAFAVVGPADGRLIPLDFLGCTYDPSLDGFWQNPDCTDPDAPENGLRFILHEVDPISGAMKGWDRLRCTDPDAPENGLRFILHEVDPITHERGTTEIGYVDLLDESVAPVYTARVIVVTSDVVRIDYAVSATVGTQTLGFTVLGFIGDGTTHIDVDLSMSFVHDFPFSIATVEQRFSVPSRDFEVDGTVVFEFNEETLQGSVEIEAAFMQGHHSVTVAGLITFSEGDLPTEGGSFEIHVDGQLFATISVDGDTITVQNAEGGELTSTEAQHVRTIFRGLEEMFDDRFEDFLRPVNWLFGDGAAA